MAYEHDTDFDPDFDQYAAEDAIFLASGRPSDDESEPETATPVTAPVRRAELCACDGCLFGGPCAVSRCDMGHPWDCSCPTCLPEMYTPHPIERRKLETLHDLEHSLDCACPTCLPEAHDTAELEAGRPDWRVA